MATPFNGWANAVSIQAETTFNAASAATVYNLVGKTRFTQSPIFVGKTAQTDVWRNRVASGVMGKYFQGTIEVEIGFNAVIQLLLVSFFELIGTSAVGGLTQYNFRPLRLGAVNSFKLCLDYNPGGPYWQYSGVVIDSITLDIRLNQTPKLTLQYKCASQSQPGIANSLGAPTTLSKFLSDHTQVSATVDAIALTRIYELSFAFAHAKRLEQFDVNGVATRCSFEGMFDFNGQIAEYFASDAALPGYVLDQADHAFTFQILDPTGTARLLSLAWPRVNFRDGTPDGIGKGDLTYRANFGGLHDTSLNTASEPKIILVA